MAKKNLKLQNKMVIDIYPSVPFNFEGTFHKPSHFPSWLKHWELGKYWQTIRVGERLFGLRIENAETDRKPKLKVSVFFNKKVTSEEIENIKQELIWRFDLDADLKEFIRIAKKDKRFYPVFKKWMGMRISNAYSLYGLLVIGVVLQNAPLRRTVQMLEILLNSFGTEVGFDSKKLFTIWRPDELSNVSEQNLRDLKIGYRAKFLKRISQDFDSGRINEIVLRKLDKDLVRRELMNLYGIGPETVRIILFEAYHQYDTFDHIAPWQQKIYSRLFYNKELVPVDRIRDDIKKQYGKYTMLAVHYIWENIFWEKQHKKIDWLEKEIRM